MNNSDGDSQNNAANVFFQNLLQALNAHIEDKISDIMSNSNTNIDSDVV